MSCKNCKHSCKNSNEGYVGCAHFLDDVEKFFNETNFAQARRGWITVGGGGMINNCIIMKEDQICNAFVEKNY